MMSSIGNWWALLVGIDRYEHSEVPRLRGCVNDVELFSGILFSRFNFSASRSIELRNEEATREAILASLDYVIDRARPGDALLIYFSGHGSQMTDREGDDPSGLDETIVPYDSGRGSHANRDITDDEIFLRLRRLEPIASQAVVIFDCGRRGVAEYADGTAIRWLAADRRPAAELPPSEVAAEAIRQSTPYYGLSGWLPSRNGYLFLASCERGETAHEYQAHHDRNAVVQGALTYFLGGELVRASPCTTFREVFERTQIQVSSTYRRQHPQIEGASDYAMFGVC